MKKTEHNVNLKDEINHEGIRIFDLSLAIHRKIEKKATVLFLFDIPNSVSWDIFFFISLGI